jgi:pyruvate kinase
VSDIAIAVREGADAIMLSGETAYGRYPVKALLVQSTVALRTEAAMTRYHVSGTPGGRTLGQACPATLPLMILIVNASGEEGA